MSQLSMPPRLRLPDSLQAQLRDYRKRVWSVKATEAAFAKSMADRDHAAFTSYLSDEAVFFGPNGGTRGKAAVSAEWKPFFDGPNAPFSWEPGVVEVLDSGTLALSSGPVHDPSGKQTATFTSIWRRDADGKWRIIFDKGNAKCP